MPLPNLNYSGEREKFGMTSTNNQFFYHLQKHLPKDSSSTHNYDESNATQNVGSKFNPQTTRRNFLSPTKYDT
jgi:hypothetical protein